MLSVRHRRAFACLAIASLSWAVAALLAVPAAADIDGFGDFSNFAINRADTSAAPVLNLAAHSIRLTGQTAPESRSIFFNTPQPIAAFTASFTYQALGSNPPVNEFDQFGACFVIQRSASGPSAVMPTGPSGTAPNRFGYGPSSLTAPFLPPVYDHSLAVSLERGMRPAGPPFSGFLPTSASGLYTGGIVDGSGTDAAPLDIFSGHPISATLTYNGSLLSETLVDTVTGGSFSQAFAVNIPALVGGPTAYVGFCADTAVFNVLTATADQASLFSDFRFHATPEPETLTLALLGVAVAASIAGLRRRWAQAERATSGPRGSPMEVRSRGP